MWVEKESDKGVKRRGGRGVERNDGVIFLAKLFYDPIELLHNYHRLRQRGVALLRVQNDRYTNMSQ